MPQQYSRSSAPRAQVNASPAVTAPKCVGGRTVTIDDALTPCALAVIVAEPAETGVTRPAPTVATWALSVDQAIGRPNTRRPEAVLSTASKLGESPTTVSRGLGDRLIDAIGVPRTPRQFTRMFPHVSVPV